MGIRTHIKCDICGDGFSLSDSVPKKHMIFIWRKDGGSYSRKKTEEMTEEIFKCKLCRKAKKCGI